MTTIEKLLEEHKDLSEHEESFARDYFAYLRMRKLMRSLAAPITPVQQQPTLHTGIFIRVEVAGKYTSIDIGDPRLSPRQVLEWMSKRLDPQGVLATMIAVKEALQRELGLTTLRNQLEASAEKELK